MIFVYPVGYGDTTAFTLFSQMTIFLGSVGGLALLAVMVFGVTKQLYLNDHEEKSFYILNKLKVRQNKKMAAVRLIDNWFYCCLLHKKGLLDHCPKLIFETRNLATEFKAVNR